MNNSRPWSKKLLFGLIATVLFFAALEGSLALFGVSSQVVLRDPFVTFAPGIPLFEERTGLEISAVADRIELRITPEAPVVALRNQAKVLTWAGKHDEAGPLALEALQTLPDDYECLFMAGTFLRRQGKPHESFDCFSNAIGQSDDAPDLHLGLAKIAVSERKLEQARLHYEEVLRLRPEDEDARQGLIAIQNR